MRITHKFLKGNGACHRQYELFQATFPESAYPDGVEITLDLCLRHSQDFDFCWAAQHILSYEQYRVFYEAELEVYGSRCKGEYWVEGIDVDEDKEVADRLRVYYYVVVAQLFAEGVAADMAAAAAR